MSEKLTENFKVGDIFQMSGPTVPKEVWHCYWRVEAIESSSLRLSSPYEDKDCTIPYWNADRIAAVRSHYPAP